MGTEGARFLWWKEQLSLLCCVLQATGQGHVDVWNESAYPNWLPSEKNTNTQNTKLVTFPSCATVLAMADWLLLAFGFVRLGCYLVLQSLAAQAQPMFMRSDNLVWLDPTKDKSPDQTAPSVFVYTCVYILNPRRNIYSYYLSIDTSCRNLLSRGILKGKFHLCHLELSRSRICH